jgi:hypothetical protein
MTVVTLAALLEARDESLTLKRSAPAWLSRARAWARQVRWTAVSARVAACVAACMLTLAGFTSKHGLVLAGLASFVIAAALFAPVAAWIVGGVSLLFLEVRRR